MQAVGHHDAAAPGHPAMFHLYTHAFFKAMLFLGSGAVIYACHHEQDIWKMGGLRKKMPVTFLTFAIGTAALIAVPYVTSGFWSKEAILGAALAEKTGSTPLFLIAAFTALLTAFYMTRLVVVTFFGQPRDHGAEHAHEVGMTMKLPLLILAVPSVIAGWFVSKDDVSYWVVAFVIALVFIVLTIAFELYVHPWLRRRRQP